MVSMVLCWEKTVAKLTYSIRPPSSDSSRMVRFLGNTVGTTLVKLKTMINNAEKLALFKVIQTVGITLVKLKTMINNAEKLALFKVIQTVGTTLVKLKTMINNVEKLALFKVKTVGTRW